ncbi:Asp/Glu/hydantoin racemase [Variovorax atrisoli]|uniref:Asp/Glu/hydantoin racemase n=1 Tax=Variovorax atrisoli TaxID=3394203 RepID=UPI000F7E3EBC|nr:Asp/Glu/hydantoin racemase [Variovorax sp. 369]RTD97862.1 Asp/Glu/hydantoin racemase [Variovorax sp. 369]
MKDALAFLHTAQVHVPTFERLVRRIEPGLRVRHVVREELLADARVVGVDDAGLVSRVHEAMHEAASEGAKVVVCTCSTIGAIAERTPTGDAFRALRIDRAMADQAVRTGPRVLIAAALESTLAPTKALVLSAAQDAGIAVQPAMLFVEDAWPHFEAGDSVRYIETLASAIRAASAEADVVVLAQASMAPVADALADLGIDVLSSPAPGTAHAVALAAAALALSPP